MLITAFIITTIESDGRERLIIGCCSKELLFASVNNFATSAYFALWSGLLGQLATI
jgi:hypothetical protein